MATKILFSGELRVEKAPPIKDDCRPCAVCKRSIPFDGIHIIGEVMNPQVREQETAKWRLQSGGYFFPEDPKLAQQHISATKPIDIFVDDVICLATLLRNHLNSPFVL